MYNYPPDTMSNKQNVGATGLVARSNQEWYNCGVFQLGNFNRIKIRNERAIMYGVQYGTCMGDVYWTCIGDVTLDVHWTGRPDRSPLHSRLMDTTETVESWGFQYDIHKP